MDKMLRGVVTLGLESISGVATCLLMQLLTSRPGACFCSYIKAT